MQDIIIRVFEFGTSTELVFNYALYKRDLTKSYRPDAQIVPGDLALWPNSQVDVNHVLFSNDTDSVSPLTINDLDEDISYYIVIWKDNYITLDKEFYVASSIRYKEDGITLIGDYPSQMPFYLQRISSNAKVFI